MSDLKAFTGTGLTDGTQPGVKKLQPCPAAAPLMEGLDDACQL